MPTHDEIMAAGGNDVGDWGEKSLSGYTRPLNIDGEDIDVSKLPKFGEDEPASSMGDLGSTGAGGDFGDLYESGARAPLRP